MQSFFLDSIAIIINIICIPHSPTVSKSLLFFVIHTIIISYFYEAAVYQILLIPPPPLFIACFIAISRCEIYRKFVPFKLNKQRRGSRYRTRWKGKRYQCRALKQSAIRFIEITSYHGGKNKPRIEKTNGSFNTTQSI